MKRFINSFGYALNGLRLFFSKEKNGQIQAVVAILVIVAGFAFKIGLYEWIIILVCIALVLALEMINSVIEKLIDHLHPARHEQVKWIKDVAAGAVLWAAIISAVIASLIFIPKVFS
ncbi:MAG: diacylglycerol kinase family protein [Bacteroidota bacterium]